MKSTLARWREIGRVGEPQATRAWMAASAKPCEAYAQSTPGER